MILTVHVKPNSRLNELTYQSEGLIKIKLNALPEAGRANEQLIKFLSAFFQTPQRNIEIISGHKGRKKNVKIDLPDEEIVKKLKQSIKET